MASLAKFFFLQARRCFTNMTLMLWCWHLRCHLKAVFPVVDVTLSSIVSLFFVAITVTLILLYLERSPVVLNLQYRHEVKKMPVCHGQPLHGMCNINCDSIWFDAFFLSSHSSIYRWIDPTSKSRWSWCQLWVCSFYRVGPCYHGVMFTFTSLRCSPSSRTHPTSVSVSC